MKLQAQRIGVTGAIFAAVTMLVLSILQSMGFYADAAGAMQQWHMFYDPATIVGTITGMIEADVITYVSILVILWIYGLLGKKMKK